MGSRRLVVALVGCLGGCKGQAAAPDAARLAALPDAGPVREVISIQQISVETASWPAAAGAPLDDRLLASRIWEGLSQSSSFEATGRRAFMPVPDAGAVRRRRARLRAVYGLEEAVAEGASDVKGTKVMRCLATMTLEFADEMAGPELWSSVGCDGDIPKDPKQLPGVAAALVECAITRGAKDLVDKEAIRRGELPAVLGALDADDPSLRQVAFATIAERHLVAALPRLIELLHAPDELVRDGAIGALVALRDRRAIKPLTELAEFKDLDLMRRIIDAVGEIGGEDAHEYLELVASGHQVAIIRELAQQALGRMGRRDDAGPRAHEAPTR
jgi:HEAT repeats